MTRAFLMLREFRELGEITRSFGAAVCRGDYPAAAGDADALVRKAKRIKAAAAQ